jgi:hypothetical protein
MLAFIKGLTTRFSSRRKHRATRLNIREAIWRHQRVVAGGDYRANSDPAGRTNAGRVAAVAHEASRVQSRHLASSPQATHRHPINVL